MGGGISVMAGCAAIMIEISSSGGLGGINLPSRDKHMVVAAQDEAAQAEYCAAFDPAVLEKLAEKAPNMRAADMQTYHITVLDAENVRHSFDLREDQITPEMLDLIDRM